MNTFKHTIRGLAVAFSLLPSLCVFSQETEPSDSSFFNLDPSLLTPHPSLYTLHSPLLTLNKEVLHSTTFGYAGMAAVYDSYLMPYRYADAVDFRIQRETARMTNLMGGRISNQAFLDVNIAADLMSDGGPSWYTGGIRYSHGWLYNFRDCNVVNPTERTTRKWNYAAGLQASAYLGGVYINRSGNNPGQAKMDIMLNATGIVTYTFHRKKHRPLLLSYQLTFPLLGAAFSPNYGQSYYEIFKLGNSDHNVVFANTINMPSNRHRLMLDIPIRKAMLRLGYDVQINQARFNNLEYNSTTMDFMIGYTKYFYRR